MKKILFGITGLTLGGAERVLVDLANALSETYDITIFTLYGNGEFECELNKNIHYLSLYQGKREELNKKEKISLSLKLQSSYFRKKIIEKCFKEEYDTVVAFLEGPITWLFSEFKDSKKIVWVHNDIESVFGKGFKARRKVKINKQMYEKYDEIVFVSKDNLDKFEQFYPNNTKSKRVIYNYIDENVVLKKVEKGSASEIKDDLPSFVQVSRLTEQKAVERLIKVHEKLIKEGLKHRVYVIGDGPLKEYLSKLIDEKQLEKTFILLGKKTNPYPYIKKANFFLLASYYEGYPMVLLEAKVLNKRILITDTAAREVLINYNQGLIVTNDKAGIYEGMKEFILNPKLKGRKKAFSNREILEDIKELLGE